MKESHLDIEQATFIRMHHLLAAVQPLFQTCWSLSRLLLPLPWGPHSGTSQTFSCNIFKTLQVELYTKRNFRCDCGPKLGQACKLLPAKEENVKNAYNQVGNLRWNLSKTFYNSSELLWLVLRVQPALPRPRRPCWRLHGPGQSVSC